MEKRLYSYIVVALVCMVTSCSKFLDTVPKDTITNLNYYETEQQLNSALAGVFQTLTKIYAHSFQGVMSLDGDEGFYNRSNQNTGIAVNLVTTSENNVTTVWTALYNGIERANLLLANINKPAMSEENRAVIKGEALFLRSYFYFLLVSYWGDVPLLLEPTSSVAQTNNPRTPSKEVYEQIIKDMTEAESLVPDVRQVTNAGHINKSAVRGLLARVCLYMAGDPVKDVSKYEMAKIWAKKVIDDGYHSLNPDYRQVFINMSQDKYDLKESIWEVEFYGYSSDGFNATGKVGIHYGISHGGQDPNYGYSFGYVAITPKLYFSYTKGDLRRDWNISTYTLSSTNPATKTYLPTYPTAMQASQRHVAKWKREYETVYPKEQGGNAVNYPLLRYSDVLLMYAEAVASQNGIVPDQDVLDQTVNQVRRRAFGNLLPNREMIDTITISTAGSGYTSAPAVTISGGGGAGGAAVATGATSGTRALNGIYLENRGGNYNSAPTITIGESWMPNVSYAAGKQVYNANKLYTVTTAGTSTATPPTQSSGASSAAITGAVFTYAGVQAKATISLTNLSEFKGDVKTTGFDDYAKFMVFLKAERSRELAFEAMRKRDLVRWGDYYNVMKQIALDFAPLGSRAFGGKAGVNTTERDVLWPIPDAETTVNKVIGQNFGW